MRRRFPTVHQADIDRPVPDQVVNDCLNGAANDEVKGLVTLFFYSQHDEAQNGAAIAKALNGVQGPVRARTFNGAIIRQYCSGSLDPVAHVVDQVNTSNGGEWQASREHAPAKLALAGFIGNWSLNYLDFSIQHMLGATRSVGGKYAPEMRLKLFGTMLVAPDNLSLLGLAKLLPEEKWTRIDGHVNQLVRLGIFQKESVIGMNPDVRILRNNYQHTHITSDQLIPESKALYAVLQGLDPDTVISVDELVTLASNADPTIDNILLRQKILGRRAHGYYPGLELVSKPIDTNQLTNIKIAPAALDPIRTLWQGIKNIRGGIDLETYIGMGKEIIDSEASCKALVEKGVASSTGSKGTGDRTAQEIMSVLQTQGECTLLELHEALGTAIQPASLRLHVNKLVAGSKISYTQVSRGPHTKDAIYKYRLNDD